MDGSAAPFIDMVESVGVVEQEQAVSLSASLRNFRKPRRCDYLDLALQRLQGGVHFVANHPVYDPSQYVEMDFARTSYIEQVSGARSFGLEKELAYAHSIQKCLPEFGQCGRPIRRRRAERRWVAIRRRIWKHKLLTIGICICLAGQSWALLRLQIRPCAE